MRLLLVIILLPFNAYTQSISFSPNSINAWGSTDYTAKSQINYKNISLVALHAPEQGAYIKRVPYKQLYLGVFYSPIQLKTDLFYLQTGIGGFHQRFPSQRGVHTHIKIEAGIQMHEYASVNYSHISNMYRGVINPGIDHINIRIHFK